VSWEGSRPEQVLDSNDFKKLKSNPKIYLEKFEGSRTNKSSTVTTNWTVPAGVYSIDATLIGGGGAGGEVQLSVQSPTNSTSSQASYGNNGINTTITYNGITYTANGGTKGQSDIISVSLPEWGWFNYDEPTFDSWSSSNNNFNYEAAGNNKPGRGGIPPYATAYVKNSVYKTINGVSSKFEVRQDGWARGGWGEDGDERHFTISVIPGSTLELSVGGNGQEIDWQSDPLGTATSNAGAIYLRYIK
jgi:hypothetical protein